MKLIVHNDTVSKGEASHKKETSEYADQRQRTIRTDPSEANRIIQVQDLIHQKKNGRHVRSCEVNRNTGDYGCQQVEAFISNMAGARLCHTPQWTNMIAELFGHEGHYLVAYDGEDVCGVLPLTRVRSRLFGDRMISQPFSDYGGPLAKMTAALKRLYQCAVEKATQYGCTSIEFRNIIEMPQSLHLRTDKISMQLRLNASPDVVWNQLRPQIRNRIRKAEKANVVVTHGHSELLKEFYRIWTIRMHQLGTPCYPLKLFQGIMKTFPENTRCFLALIEDVPVATLFAYTYNGCVHSRWGAALREYDSIGPNYLLNWSAIRFYCHQGIEWYDFGRSTINSGQHTFKKRWGAEAIPFKWQYWTKNGQVPSLMQTDNPKFQKKIRAWQKMPLWMSRAIGPAISRQLP